MGFGSSLKKAVKKTSPTRFVGKQVGKVGNKLFDADAAAKWRKISPIAGALGENYQRHLLNVSINPTGLAGAKDADYYGARDRGATSKTALRHTYQNTLKSGAILATIAGGVAVGGAAGAGGAGGAAAAPGAVAGATAAPAAAGAATAGGLSLPSLATIGSGLGLVSQVQNLAGADQDDPYTAHGSGTGDVTAGQMDDGRGWLDGFSWENAAPAIALTLLGLSMVLLGLPSKR